MKKRLKIFALVLLALVSISICIAYLFYFTLNKRQLCIVNSSFEDFYVNIKLGELIIFDSNVKSNSEKNIGLFIKEENDLIINCSIGNKIFKEVQIYETHTCPRKYYIMATSKNELVVESIFTPLYDKIVNTH